MKLTGYTFTKPNIEICVLPRGDGDIVFRAQAVLDYDDYEKYCPIPKPPQKNIAKQGIVDDYEDATYLQQVALRAEQKMNWLILKSLEATEGLVWETVKMDKPSTWGNYKDELKAAFFSTTEIQRIQNACFNANSLNELRVEEARKNFLLGQGKEQENTSGPSTGQKSTPSGKPAN